MLGNDNTRNQISSKLSKLKGKNSISVITINKKNKEDPRAGI